MWPDLRITTKARSMSSKNHSAVRETVTAWKIAGLLATVTNSTTAVSSIQKNQRTNTTTTKNYMERRAAQYAQKQNAIKST